MNVRRFSQRLSTDLASNDLAGHIDQIARHMAGPHGLTEAACVHGVKEGAAVKPAPVCEMCSALFGGRRKRLSGKLLRSTMYPAPFCLTCCPCSLCIQCPRRPLVW